MASINGAGGPNRDPIIEEWLKDWPKASSATPTQDASKAQERLFEQHFKDLSDIADDDPDAIKKQKARAALVLAQLTQQNAIDTSAWSAANKDLLEKSTTAAQRLCQTDLSKFLKAANTDQPQRTIDSRGFVSRVPTAPWPVANMDGAAPTPRPLDPRYYDGTRAERLALREELRTKAATDPDLQQRFAQQPRVKALLESVQPDLDAAAKYGETLIATAKQSIGKVEADVAQIKERLQSNEKLLAERSPFEAFSDECKQYKELIKADRSELRKAERALRSEQAKAKKLEEAVNKFELDRLGAQKELDKLTQKLGADEAAFALVGLPSKASKKQCEQIYELDKRRSQRLPTLDPKTLSPEIRAVYEAAQTPETAQAKLLPLFQAAYVKELQAFIGREMGGLAHAQRELEAAKATGNAEGITAAQAKLVDIAQNVGEARVKAAQTRVAMAKAAGDKEAEAHAREELHQAKAAAQQAAAPPPAVEPDLEAAKRTAEAQRAEQALQDFKTFENYGVDPNALEDLKALAARRELGLLDPDMVAQIEGYPDRKRGTQRKLFAIYDEILSLLNSGLPFEVILVKVMSLLVAGEEIRLKDKMEEMSAEQRIEKINDGINKANGKLADARRMAGEKGTRALLEAQTKRDKARNADQLGEAKKWDERAKFIEQEIGKAQETVRLMNNREIDRLDSTKFGLTGKSTTLLMQEMQAQQQLFIQNMNALQAILRQVHELVMKIISNMR